MHIAHLARAENELLASALEDKLRFVFREHVRGAVVLLRQLLLPLHHFAGEANDHVMLIGLSVDRDGPECSPFDLHGLILVPGSGRGSDSGEPRSDAIGAGWTPLVPVGHQTRPAPRHSSSNPIILDKVSRGDNAGEPNRPNNFTSG